jgi:hypothetical protein
MYHISICADRWKAEKQSKHEPVKSLPVPSRDNSVKENERKELAKIRPPIA